MAVFLLYVISPIIIDFYVRLCFSKYDNKLNEKKIKIIKLILIGLVVFLMIGLRKYTNGSGDSYVYYQHWRDLGSIPFARFKDVVANSDMEMGYTAVVFVLSHVFKNPQFVFVLSALFFAVAVCYFVYKNCDDVALAMLVFNTLELFIFMVQGLRQAVAMSICLFAIEQCKKRKLLRFSILVGIAMLFHASAIVFFVVYFIPFLKMNGRSIFAIIAAFGISAALIPYFFDFINLFVRDEYDIVQDAAEGTGIVALLIYLAIIIAGFILRPKEANEENNKHYSFFFFLTCIGMFVFALRNYTASITERISFYYAFGQMVLISNMGRSLDDSSTRWLFKMLIIVLCFGVAVYKAGYTSLVPYMFFWQ